MRSVLAPGWLSGVAIGAVVAVNLAGLWGIAVARQGARDEARRSFGVEVSSRAGALESRLSDVRSDLAFLGGTPTIARLDESRHSPEETELLRQGAVSALLLFLRSHPEVVRIGVLSSSGQPLVHVGRRGGIPVFWASASPTGDEGAAVDPTRPRLTTRLPGGEGSGPSGGVRIEAEVGPSALLETVEGTSDTLWSCTLSVHSGATLARRPTAVRSSDAASGAAPVTEAPVRAEGWTRDEPLRLGCRTQATVEDLAEPVWVRYRTTLALNAVVMLLAFLLGGFALQQAGRRARLEARADEQSRVRELERQLFHAERLATVGRLAAGIAHEINNPLEGMANYLTLARNALGRGDSKGAAGYLASVGQGLDRAAAIVRQVLAQSDPAKAPQTPVDLNRVLLETGQFVGARREFSHIRFSLDLAEGSLMVRGNAVMLGQVAVNLILNACEVQPETGEVAVTSRLDLEQAVVEFADRGPGIAEADRQRVFEPFFSTGGSTGLGLSICHNIVRQHDGELDVRERPGGGSVFRMSLPGLAKTAPMEASATAEART